MVFESSGLISAPRSTISPITSFQSRSGRRVATASSTEWHDPQARSTTTLPGPSGSPACLPAAAGKQAGLPEGPGKVVVERACGSCHSVEEAVATRRPERDWKDVIGLMVDRGAEISPDDSKTILAYLAKNFGPK